MKGGGWEEEMERGRGLYGKRTVAEGENGIRKRWEKIEMYEGGVKVDERRNGRGRQAGRQAGKQVDREWVKEDK